MPEGPGVQGYVPNNGSKKGPATYKAAKGPVGKGGYTGKNTKPATNKRINMVDKKVKRVSNKIMRYRSQTPGNPAPGTRGY